MLNYNLQNRRVLDNDAIMRVAPSVFAQKPHSAVTDKYRFIPTYEMLATLQAQGWECVQAGEHRVRNASKRGYQKHKLRVRNPNLAKVGDSEIDLLVYNSHDRTTGFKFLAGLFRAVCANGMVVGENLFAPISVKHVGYKSEDAIAASYRVIESVPQIAASIDAMRSIILTEEERVSRHACAACRGRAAAGGDRNGGVGHRQSRSTLTCALRSINTSRPSRRLRRP